MKRMISIITTCLVVSAANATTNVKGGFTGPVAGTNQPITVQKAMDMRDNARVVLRGRIIESLGDEKYTFADETGRIVIEIDDDDWNGVNVTPETIIEIFGEVDKGWFKRTKIEVDSLVVK